MTKGTDEVIDDRLDDALDALDHIARVCRGSRTSSRRIRWIEARARSAIAGDRNWRELDLPKLDPRVERLERLLTEALPYLRGLADDSDHAARLGRKIATVLQEARRAEEAAKR